MEGEKEQELDGSCFGTETLQHQEEMQKEASFNSI